jgi:hypothetical protein
MKELDTLVRTAVAVVKTRREARRADADGANDAAKKKYGAAFSSALDDLDKAVVALAKKPKKPGAPAAPFDWAGIAKTAIAMFRMAKSVKRGRPIEDVIDGEVV